MFLRTRISFLGVFHAQSHEGVCFNRRCELMYVILLYFHHCLFNSHVFTSQRANQLEVHFCSVKTGSEGFSYILIHNNTTFF